MPQPYPGQQWKHGWKPLTPAAALAKNHGRKPGPDSKISKMVDDAIRQMLEARRGKEGMKSGRELGFGEGVYTPRQNPSGRYPKAEILRGRGTLATVDRGSGRETTTLHKMPDGHYELISRPGEGQHTLRNVLTGEETTRTFRSGLTAQKIAEELYQDSRDKKARQTAADTTRATRRQRIPELAANGLPALQRVGDPTRNADGSISIRARGTEGVYDGVLRNGVLHVTRNGRTANAQVPPGQDPTRVFQRLVAKLRAST